MSSNTTTSPRVLTLPLTPIVLTMAGQKRRITALYPEDQHADPLTQEGKDRAKTAASNNGPFAQVTATASVVPPESVSRAPLVSDTKSPSLAAAVASQAGSQNTWRFYHEVPLWKEVVERRLNSTVEEFTARRQKERDSRKTLLKKPGTMTYPAPQACASDTSDVKPPNDGPRHKTPYQTNQIGHTLARTGFVLENDEVYYSIGGVPMKFKVERVATNRATLINPHIPTMPETQAPIEELKISHSRAPDLTFKSNPRKRKPKKSCAGSPSTASLTL